MTTYTYTWKPIEPPADPAALARQEVAALRQLWVRQRQRLEQQQSWRIFIEKMNRWWCIETGAIERIFDLSLGATQTLVEHGFAANLLSHGDTNIPHGLLIQILQDHREALDFLMDVIGGTRPFTTGWIKQLHALMCRHQEASEAQTPEGRLVQLPMERGTYKLRPNNPTRADGSLHEYCPPEHVASEMERLVELYHALPSEYPEVRAAWLHHAFTQIHPFQDGNGRVARALASMDFIRAGLFPLLVPRNEKHSRYLPALEAADGGNLAPLVTYFGECMERVMLRAFSEAESVVGPKESLASAIEAVGTRLAARKRYSDADRAFMARRMSQLSDLCAAQLGQTAQELEKRYSMIEAQVARSEEGKNDHYFRAQILHLARQHGYWADLRETRRWVRLRLKDGGIFDVAVVLHFVGPSSASSCVATAFIQHREDLAEPLPSEVHDELDIKPFLFTPDEEEANLRTRFEQWLTEMTIQALALWTRYL